CRRDGHFLTSAERSTRRNTKRRTNALSRARKLGGDHIVQVFTRLLRRKRRKQRSVRQVAISGELLIERRRRTAGRSHRRTQQGAHHTTNLIRLAFGGTGVVAFPGLARTASWANPPSSRLPSFAERAAVRTISPTSVFKDSAISPISPSSDPSVV